MKTKKSLKADTELNEKISENRQKEQSEYVKTIIIHAIQNSKERRERRNYTPPINEPCDTTKCKECVLLYLCKAKTPQTLYIGLI